MLTCRGAILNIGPNTHVLVAGQFGLVLPSQRTEKKSSNSNSNATAMRIEFGLTFLLQRRQIHWRIPHSFAGRGIVVVPAAVSNKPTAFVSSKQLQLHPNIHPPNVKRGKYDTPTNSTANTVAVHILAG